jgi:hypothetical protein
MNLKNTRNADQLRLALDYFFSNAEFRKLVSYENVHLSTLLQLLNKEPKEVT